MDLKILLWDDLESKERVAKTSYISTLIDEIKVCSTSN